MDVPPKLKGSGLTKKQRSLALDRFHTLRPFLEDGVPLARIAQENHLHVRTVSRWAKNYHQLGLAGLCRQPRTDKNKRRRMSPTLQQFTEGLALQKPPLTATAVHRQAASVAARLGEPVPSYRTVHKPVAPSP